MKSTSLFAYPGLLKLLLCAIAKPAAHKRYLLRKTKIYPCVSKLSYALSQKKISCEQRVCFYWVVNVSGSARTSGCPYMGRFSPREAKQIKQERHLPHGLERQKTQQKLTANGELRAEQTASNDLSVSRWLSYGRVCKPS